MTSRASQRGFSLVELVATVALLGVMAGIALPVADKMQRRVRELQLKQELRDMRRAIDSYHQLVQVVPTAKEDATDEPWPEDLEVLIDGVDLGLAKEVKIKFLRRIPIDPLTREAEWGKRSNKQDMDDESWDSENVFDVFSLAEGNALDGSEYKDW